MSGSSCHPLIVAMTNATVEFVFLFKLDAFCFCLFFKHRPTPNL